MLNPHEELAKRQEQAQNAIGQASHERYQCSRIVESKQKRIAELDELIGQAEVALDEIRFGMKDFNDFMTEQHGALSVQEIGELIEAGAHAKDESEAAPESTED